MINGTPTPAELDSAALQATEFPEYYKNAAETMKNVASLMQKNQELAAQANYELAQKTIDTASQYGAQVADKTAELYAASEKWAGNTYESAVNKTSDLIEKSVDGYGKASKQASTAIDKTWAHVADESVKVKEALIDRVNELDRQLETATGEAKEVLIREYNKTMRYLRNEQEDYSVHTDKLPEGLQNYDPKMPDARVPYPNEYNPIDIPSGQACIPCGTMEPCCIQSGGVVDITDSTRRLSWPIIKKDSPTAMFVIAKERVHQEPAAKVDVHMIGMMCQRGVDDYPLATIETSDGSDGYHSIKDLTKAKRIALHYPLGLENYNFVISNPLVSDSVVNATLFIFSIMDIIKQSSANRIQYRFSPMQCASSTACYPTFTIIPVPHIKVGGKLEYALSLNFTTAGFKFKNDHTSSIVAEYGDATLTFEDNDKDKTPSSNGPKKNKKMKELKGPLSVISNVTNVLIEYFSGNSDPEMDNTEYASGMRIFFKFEIDCSGIELKGKKGTPDLALRGGGLKSKVSAGAEFKLDIIDLIAMYILGPKYADNVRTIRSKMKKGKTINGVVAADLIGAGVGGIGFTVPKIAELTIPVDEGFDFDLSAKVIYENEFKLIAKMEAKIRIGFEVFKIAGEAGAEGSLHTAFNWEWRNKGQGLERRSYFEGLTVKYKAYVKIYGKNKKSKTKRTFEQNFGGNELLVINQVNKEFEHAENQENAIARDIASDKNNPFVGEILPIMAPTVSIKDHENPPWTKVS